MDFITNIAFVGNGQLGIITITLLFQTSLWKLQNKLKIILKAWHFTSFAFGPRFYTSSWAKAAL